MKISVIVPVYNGEKYINQCLNSLKNQTQTEMEVIIVNDGSTDKTQQKLDLYAQQNEGMDIKIIHKNNAGLPQARKTGVENATGEYIGFLDIDDWAEPYTYLELVKKAEEYSADVVCGGYQMDFSDKHKIVKQELNPDHVVSGLTALKFLHQRKAIYPFAWNKLYKRELLDGIKYPTGNFVGEDYAIVIQILEKSEKVAVVAAAGHHYTQVENSMSRGGYNENYIKAFRNYGDIRDYLLFKYPEIENNVNNYMITEYMAMIVAMGKNGRYNYEMIQQIKKFVKKNIGPYLKSKEIGITMKGSAIAVSIWYRLLIFVYNLTAKLLGNYVTS